MTAGPSDQRALASIAVQFFINGAVFASFVPRLPEIRDRLDITISGVGLLFTIASAVSLLGTVAAPWAVERFGTRRTLIGGASILIGSLPFVGFGQSMLIVGAAMAAMGAFDVVVDVAMNLQASWLSARRAVPVMSRLHGLWSLGTVIGGLAASRLASIGVTLETHLVSVSIILALALLFVADGLPRRDVPTEQTTDVARGRMRGRSMLVLCAMAGAFAVAVEMISSDWAAFRLRDDFATSLGLAGLGFVAYTAGMTVGRFAGDAVEMRLGRSRMLQAAIVLTACGLVGASFGPTPWFVLVSYALAGLGNATLFPMLYDVAAQLPGRSAAALGALTAGSRMMLLVAPVVVGSLAVRLENVGQAVAVVTLPSIVGAALVTTTLLKAHSTN